MIEIINIIESKDVVKYLQERKLISQYKKIKSLIILGQSGKSDLKIRQPKENGIWSFRINKKYRAFAIYEDKILKVYKIYDHQ